jgi:hypothetical protein
MSTFLIQCCDIYVYATDSYLDTERLHLLSEIVSEGVWFIVH